MITLQILFLTFLSYFFYYNFFIYVCHWDIDAEVSFLRLFLLTHKSYNVPVDLVVLFTSVHQLVLIGQIIRVGIPENISFMKR